MSRTQIWSSGGGVQSTAIAALIVQGKLPKPDLAVISDTERELSTTWHYLNVVTAPALKAIGVTIHRVKKSTYATVDLYGGADGNSILIPAFTTQGDDIGKLPGYCSNEWKQRVVQRWAVSEHGVSSACIWMGISTDEQRRVSLPSGKWEKRYPLVELNMSRADCFRVVEEIGWPEPPRSSCWMCPNHREDEWLWQEKHALGDHRKAIAFDVEIRKKDPHAWLHPSAQPLGDVKFDVANEVMFGKGCQTGLCFV
jgi:hypothetical protein